MNVTTQMDGFIHTVEVHVMSAMIIYHCICIVALSVILWRVDDVDIIDYNCIFLQFYIDKYII
jgi:hypothetical protein